MQQASNNEKNNFLNVIKNTLTSDMLLNWEQKSLTTQRSIRKTQLRFRQVVGSQFCLQILDVIVKSLPQTVWYYSDTEQ